MPGGFGPKLTGPDLCGSLWSVADSGDPSVPILKKTYSPNTVLCHQGEICDEIYLLLRGAIQIVSNDHVVRTVDKPGSFVGELTPLFNQPRSTTLVTREECECLTIAAGYLESLLAQSPEEDVNLLGILAERLLRKTDTFRELEHELSLDWGSEDVEPDKIEEEGELRRIVLVARDDTLLETLNYHLMPLGYYVRHTAKPLEAINDLDDGTPDMVIFNSVDFPRQWKPMLKLLREKKSAEESVFVLISESSLPFHEAAKAAFLNANGIIPIDQSGPRLVARLEELLRRYKSIQDRRRSPRLIPFETEKFQMLFTHPVRYVLVSGVVSDISLDGARFTPSDISVTDDLEPDQRIPNCSLRIGGDIISVNSRVARNEKDIGLEFEAFRSDGDQKLFQYLIERPEREMRHATRRP